MEKNKKQITEKKETFVTEAELIDALLNVASKDQLKALDEKFALKLHSHTSFASIDHTHSNYAEKDHEHTQYVKLGDVIDYCKKNCASKKHEHKKYENRGVVPFDAFGIAVFFLGLGAIIAGMVILWKLGTALLVGGIIVFIIGIIFMGASASSSKEEDTENGGE